MCSATVVEDNGCLGLSLDVHHVGRAIAAQSRSDLADAFVGRD
jgi:hypothetical protein